MAEQGTRYRTSIALDLVSHAAIFALAGALYLTFSPFNQSLALVAMLWRAAEGTILTLNEVGNAVLLEVAQNIVSATGVEAASLETLGRPQWGSVRTLGWASDRNAPYCLLFLLKNSQITSLP